MKKVKKFWTKNEKKGYFRITSFKGRRKRYASWKEKTGYLETN